MCILVGASKLEVCGPNDGIVIFFGVLGAVAFSLLRLHGTALLEAQTAGC